MWSLWRRTRGGFSGVELARLPEGGGVLDQHAPTMEGLDVISETWAWLEDRFPRDPAPKKQRARAR